MHKVQGSKYIVSISNKRNKTIDSAFYKVDVYYSEIISEQTGFEPINLILETKILPIKLLP